MTGRSFFFALLLLAPVAQLACSSSEPSPSPEGSAQDLSAHPGACGGTTCGAGLRCCNEKCQPAGLACQLPPSGTCGGATCGAGLRCCNDKCQPAGLACQAPLSGEGQPCGDDVATQKKCAAGLACIFPSSGPISEHTAGTCHKALALDGEWGADGAILTFDHARAQIEFGCGSATLDTIVQTGATTFTATGTRAAGTGVAFPPGLGPKPEDATFKGTLSGDTLKLDMTVNGETTSNTFTKDRHIDLIRCL